MDLVLRPQPCVLKQLPTANSPLQTLHALSPQNPPFALSPHRYNLDPGGGWVDFKEAMAVFVGVWLTIFVQHGSGEWENYGMDG